jgi:hypothetical protein
LSSLCPIRRMTLQLLLTNGKTHSLKHSYGQDLGWQSWPTTHLSVEPTSPAGKVSPGHG